MVPIEGSEPRTRGDVHPDQRVAYSPASSLSTSPLTPTLGGEASVGKRADHISEDCGSALSCVRVPPSHTVLGVDDSGGQLTGPASCSLAQEERTQSTLKVDSDHDWQINIWIP